MATSAEDKPAIDITPIPFSSYSFTPQADDPGAHQDNVGKVVSKSILVARPPVCADFELLDVSALVTMPDTGHATIRINACLCPADQATTRGFFYQEPAITVATAESVKPVFVTLTHTFIKLKPTDQHPSDLQIDIFTWGPNGAPDTTGLRVDWRCRIPTFNVIQ